jgi:hypothetical protein
MNCVGRSPLLIRLASLLRELNNFERVVINNFERIVTTICRFIISRSIVMKSSFNRDNNYCHYVIQRIAGYIIMRQDLT